MASPASSISSISDDEGESDVVILSDDEEQTEEEEDVEEYQTYPFLKVDQINWKERECEKIPISYNLFAHLHQVQVCLMKDRVLNNPCDSIYCKDMKMLLMHVQKCTEGINCTQEYCCYVRSAIEHWRSCELKSTCTKGCREVYKEYTVAKYRTGLRSFSGMKLDPPNAAEKFHLLAFEMFLEEEKFSSSLVIIGHLLHVIICQLHRMAFVQYKCNYKDCAELRSFVLHVMKCMRAKSCNDLKCSQYRAMIIHWRACRTERNCIFCYDYSRYKSVETYNRLISSLIRQNIRYINEFTAKSIELLKIAREQTNLFSYMDYSCLLCDFTYQRPEIPEEFRFHIKRLLPPMVYSGVPEDFTISATGSSSSKLFQEISEDMRMYLINRLAKSYLNYLPDWNYENKKSIPLLFWRFAHLIEIQEMETNTNRNEYYDAIWSNITERNGRCISNCDCFESSKRMLNNLDRWGCCSNYPHINLPFIPSEKMIACNFDVINDSRRSAIRLLVQANIHTKPEFKNKDNELKAIVYYSQILEKKVFEAAMKLVEYEKMIYYIFSGIMKAHRIAEQRKIQRKYEKENFY